MSTNTDYSWYWYVRKKGTKYYIGVVDNNGDAPTSALDIEIYYDEIPDAVDDQDDTFPLPDQYEMGLIKGVAAELMLMSPGKTSADILLRNQYIAEYEDAIKQAIHMQIRESEEPIIRPMDLRDDDSWGR